MHQHLTLSSVFLSVTCESLGSKDRFLESRYPRRIFWVYDWDVLKREKKYNENIYFEVIEKITLLTVSCCVKIKKKSLKRIPRKFVRLNNLLQIYFTIKVFPTSFVAVKNKQSSRNWRNCNKLRLNNKWQQTEKNQHWKILQIFW